MNKPLIAITPSYDGSLVRGKVKVSGEYLNALWQAGAMPVPVTWLDPKTPEDAKKLAEYTEIFDGFLFSGGVDVDPHIYGDTEIHPKTDICAERDAFELALFESVWKNTDKPILGICRGMQLVNVALGGTLYQHIEGHKQTEAGNVHDRVANVKKDTALYRIFGSTDTIGINSFHHQAIKDVAPALVAAALSPDGIVEAVEGKDMAADTDNKSRFIAAVQWHPELFYAQDPAAFALFDAFVSHCRKSSRPFLERKGPKEL